MSKVYSPCGADGFEFCHPVNEEDFSVFSDLDGTPRRSVWRSPRMRLVRTDQGKRLAASDSPWLGSHALIFRQSAVTALTKLLVTYGELLPLDCDDADLVLFNVTTVLDGLDEEASEVRRLPDGRIFRVARYAFHEDIIADIDAFKIKSLGVSPTYVSEHFAERVRAAGLRGLDFYQLWTS